MSDELPLIAAIEAGGTKFVCAVGTGPNDLRDIARIPSTTPEETLAEVCRYLAMAKSKHGPFAAIGVGSFGPVDLDKNSETYGYITTTPKPGWQYVEVVNMLKSRYHVPVAFDTDVNAAVLGEYLCSGVYSGEILAYKRGAFYGSSSAEGQSPGSLHRRGSPASARSWRFFGVWLGARDGVGVLVGVRARAGGRRYAGGRGRAGGGHRRGRVDAADGRQHPHLAEGPRLLAL